MTHSVNVQDQTFIMHPSGAMLWLEKSFLLISDVHLGKISHFRKFGAAVPRDAIQANFKLLDESVDFFKPKSIYFLGDLFHSHLNTEWDFFETWVSKINADINLIHGNHDIISPLKYEALGIQVHTEHLIEDFLLTHHPEERKGYFNFCGHIHPAIKIHGKGKQSLRLPCFFKGPNQMILPAFGEFTGSHTLKQKKNNEAYALADGMVIKI